MSKYNFFKVKNFKKLPVPSFEQDTCNISILLTLAIALISFEERMVFELNHDLD